MGWGSLAFEPADERRRKAPAKRWKLGISIQIFNF
jgi:hypothetical protein